MSTSRTADTIFSGKGTDDVLATDVYAIKGSANRNSIFDSMKGAAGDAAEYAKSSPSSIANLLKTAAEMKVNGLSSGDAMSRLGYGMNTSTLLKLSQSSNSIINTIGKGLGLNPELTDSIKLAVGGSISYITTNDVTGSQSSFEIAKDLLGDSELMQFFDLEAESSMLNGVFSDAVNYGMYDVIDIAKSGNKYDNLSFTAAVMTVSTGAISTGDIDAILMVLKHISIDQFLGENPDAIKEILRNYRFSPKVTPDQYAAKLTQLVDLLVKLDAHWYETTLVDKWVINYDVMSVISDSAKTLFLLDPVLRPIVLTAPFYPATNAINLATKMYPGSAIGAVK